MFANFKRIADGVQGLTKELRLLRSALSEAPQDEHLEARIGELERTVHNTVAEAEAMLTRAESTFKAARAAEERERHHRVKAEEAEERLAEVDDESLDPFERAGKAWQLHQGNDEGGEGEGVPPVHRGVEIPPSPEQLAARRKFGG